LRELFDILVGDFARSIQNEVRASAKDGAMLFAATLLLVCGFVALMFAAYVFLLRFMEPVFAALIIAALFVIAAALLLVAIKTRAAHGKPPQIGDPDIGDPGDPGDLGGLEDMARSYMRRHGKQATLLSLLAGVVVGSSPEVRRTLASALDMALSDRKERKERKDRDDRRRR